MQSCLWRRLWLTFGIQFGHGAVSCLCIYLFVRSLGLWAFDFCQNRPHSIRRESERETRGLSLARSLFNCHSFIFLIDNFFHLLQSVLLLRALFFQKVEKEVFASSQMKISDAPLRYVASFWSSRQGPCA